MKRVINGLGVGSSRKNAEKVPFASIKLSLKNLSEKREKPRINKVPINTPLLIGVANGQVMRMCCLSVGFFVIIRLYCRYNGNKYQFAVRCFA